MTDYISVYLHSFPSSPVSLGKITTYLQVVRKRMQNTKHLQVNNNEIFDGSGGGDTDLN